MLLGMACGSDTPIQADADTSDASLDVITVDSTIDAVVDASNGPDDVVVDALQCGTIVPTGSVATNFQINARHDGVQPSDHLALPLCKRWSVPFGGSISFPIVAGGRVFVTVADLDSGTGTDVYALDEKSGTLLWGPVALTSFQSWSALTYETNLFALDNGGTLAAFDPGTGEKIWQAKTPPTYVDSAPTAWGGRIYFSGDGSIYAYDEIDGTLGWASSVQKGGDEGTPAVDLSGVYVAYDCGQIYSFDPSSGGLNWQHSGDCEGGSGTTPALRGGTLFTRAYDYPNTANLMVIASSGVAIGSFALAQTVPPALSFIGGDTLLRVINGSMDAWQFTQQKTLWTFVGDGQLVTAPLVASSTVVVGSSSGNLYALDAVTGTLVSSDAIGYPLKYTESGSGLTTGLAIADGMLFISANGALIAY